MRGKLPCRHGERKPVDTQGAPAHKKGRARPFGCRCKPEAELLQIAGVDLFSRGRPYEASLRRFGPDEEGQNLICLRFAASFALQLAIKAELMEEKRKHPRTEIDEPAYVSSGGSVMSCVVRNISAEGAAIDVENPAFVPARFRLVMAKDSSVRECRVAWIQQNRIGLTFV